MSGNFRDDRVAGKAAISCLGILVLLGSVALASGVTGGQSDDGPWWFPTQGPWLETHVLEADDADDPKWFGAQVAIDGDTMIASTQSDFFHDQWGSCPADDGCDRVYVFERQGDGMWEKTDVLIPDDARPGDTFGFALDVDEQSGVIVVGNPGQKAKADQIYIFERQEDRSWVQTAMFKKEYPDLPEDHWTLFGISVDVSGHTVLTTDVAQFEGPGRSFVFDKIDGVWEETAEILGGSGPLGSGLAGNVAVTKTGVREEFCEGINWSSQHIIVHERIDGEWVIQAKLFPEPSHEKPQTLPTRIALSEDGKTIVAGAAVDRRVYGVHTEHCLYLDAPEPVGSQHIHTSSGLAGAVGSAWIYEEIDGEWQMTADIPNPLPNPGWFTGGSVFGAAVDVSGSSVVIGADGDYYDGGSASGTAYVYEKILDEWLLQGRLRPHDPSETDFFGTSVGISGSTIAVGADNSLENGSVRFYNILLAGQIDRLDEIGPGVLPSDHTEAV